MNLLKNSLKQKYSQIPNELITDLSISAGALRVLLYLFTKPDDWNVYNSDICNNLNINEKTLSKYWKELLASKWLRRNKSISEDGKFTGGYIYHIGQFTTSDILSYMEKPTDIINNIPCTKNKELKTIEENLVSFIPNSELVAIKYAKDFIEYRKSIKDKIKTDRPIKLYLKNLSELKKDDYDINKCIEEMKAREWKTIDKSYLKNRDDLKVNTKTIGGWSV